MSSDERIQQAQAFLQEAVYRSRARQAAGTELAGGDPNCGLGEKAALELNLSERGAELFASLWPDPDAVDRAHVLGVLSDWVTRQDALDRKRNHFLRDFRHANGFDRTAYTAEQREAFEQGLDAVNREVNDGLRQAAQRLLETST